MAEDYFVGVLCTNGLAKFLLINIYIPPTSSRVAPPDYAACLARIHQWVNSIRLSFGTIDQVAWCGDFNARIGQRLYPDADDTTTNTRGL